MSVTTMLPRILEEFPADLRTPMWHFAEMLEERYIIPHQDFTELKHTVERSERRLDRLTEAVERLAEAQQRTEQKVERLAEAQQRTEQRVEQLAEAQQRTEQRVEQLAEAQQRTEQKVEQLAEAQQRTEQKVEQLAEAQKDLAESQKALTEAQRRTEQAIQALTTTVQDLKQSMNDRFAELGSRWGLHTESAFRNTIRRIVRDMDGVTVTSRTYGGRQVDVVIRNGEHILLEITARMHRNDIRKLYQSADEYAVKEGVEPTLMIATAYVSPRLMEEVVNLERPIEIFSYDDEDEDPAEIE